ncbi:LysM peptidoglycan-binding domain-containing protein [Spirosoma endbachense]|uniref:LysM domain-containing protein n=1 Tax=Spirosoma endbachense TaxID=2666025 RepID=A0A6P1VX33_9BACT|nr:hypothetical protein [Spirosoma endbachense]QHV97315.1 hypothetical protein GJR95_20910 [Spirosoma endbachense]
MAEGMMIGSECADWWAKRNKAYHAELEQYILENPGNFAVYIATAKASGADYLNTMYVDLARIGEGAADGSLKGAVQDFLRVLNFVPQGKVLKESATYFRAIVQQFTNLTIWRWLRGGLCAPIAIGQALQRAGYRIAISVSEIAKAIGIPLETIATSGTPNRLIADALRRLGVVFSEIDTARRRGLTSFEELKRLAIQEDRPLLVVLKSLENNVGHLILVSKTLSGIKIIDRYGLFNSLDELSKFYRQGTFVVNTSQPLFSIVNAVVDEKLIYLANQAGLLAVLVRQSLAVFDINFAKFSSSEALDADFEKFLDAKGKKPPAVLGDIVITGGYRIEVIPSDPTRSSLSAIARAQYGAVDLWPLIFDLNKEVIGKNPNRLVAGTKLLLLPIERYSTTELNDARKRSPTWRNYPS